MWQKCKPIPTEKPFWLMLVDKGAHILQKSFEDAHQNEWTTQGVVVKGYSMKGFNLIIGIN